MAEDPAIAFAALSSEEQQKQLDGPGLEPPPGVISNFENPPNGDAIAHGALAACIAGVVIFIALAIYAKAKHFRKVQLEDGLAVIAIIGWIVFITVLYKVVIEYGFFINQWNFHLREVPEYFHLIYIITLAYFITMSTIKAAIVLEWIRIFVPRGTRNAFFWTCHALAWLNATACVIMLFVVAFACDPIERYWNPLVLGKCLDANATAFIAPIINLIFDIIALILPQKVIWGLHLSWRKKMGVSVLFALGILACVSASIRIGVSKTFWLEPDRTYNIASTALWCLAEMSAGILIYCIPSAPAAVGRLKKKVTSVSRSRSGYSTGEGASKDRQMGGSWRDGKKSSAPKQNPGPYEEIDEVPLTTLSRTNAVASRQSPVEGNGDSYDGKGITRTTQVTATFTRNSQEGTDDYIRQHPWASASERV